MNEKISKKILFYISIILIIIILMICYFYTRKSKNQNQYSEKEKLNNQIENNIVSVQAEKPTEASVEGIATEKKGIKYVVDLKFKSSACIKQVQDEEKGTIIPNDSNMENHLELATNILGKRDEIYKYKIEMASGEIVEKEFKINDFIPATVEDNKWKDLAYITNYNPNMDLLTINNAYKKGNEAKTTEQTDAISKAETQDNNTIVNAIKDTTGGWTIISKDNNIDNASSLKEYQKYNLVTNNKYVQGSWGTWGGSYTRYNCETAYTSWGFSESSGFYPAGRMDYVTYGSGYAISPTCVKEFSIYCVDAFVSKYSEKSRCLYASMQTTYSKGSYIDKFTDRNDYTTGANNGFWYDAMGNLKKYYTYKYDDNLKMLSKYDTDTKEITTKQIDFDTAKSAMCTEIKADNMNYKAYYSLDNTNWIEITGDELNGEKEIDFGATTSKVYLKITNNEATINSIKVYV